MAAARGGTERRRVGHAVAVDGPARGALCGRARARAPGALMVLHSGDTTVAFPMTPEAARRLRGGLDDLEATFRGRDELRESGSRPKKFPSLNYTYKPEEGDVEPAVAAFCNPNGYPNALQAEVLVTVQTDAGVKVMSEAKLDHLCEDVDNFLESYGFHEED